MRTTPSPFRLRLLGLLSAGVALVATAGSAAALTEAISSPAPSTTPSPTPAPVVCDLVADEADLPTAETCTALDGAVQPLLPAVPPVAGADVTPADPQPEPSGPTQPGAGAEPAAVQAAGSEPAPVQEPDGGAPSAAAVPRLQPVHVPAPGDGVRSRTGLAAIAPLVSVPAVVVGRPLGLAPMVAPAAGSEVDFAGTAALAPAGPGAAAVATAAAALLIAVAMTVPPAATRPLRSCGRWIRSLPSSSGRTSTDDGAGRPSDAHR